MISIEKVKRYCKDYTKIENYDLAIKDESQIWECHHRLETETSDGEIRPRKAQLSMKELISLGMYYDRPAEELIFLTRKEHKKIHRTLECDEYFGSYKEDQKAYNKAYNEAHKEEKKAWSKSWEEAHREELLAYKKAYRESHKEEHNRDNKVRNFINRKGKVPVESLPKTWNEEDIKYYLLRISELTNV